MATDADVTADSLASAVGAMFNLGQVGIDWATVARAVLAFREEGRQRWLDAHDELSDKPRHRVGDPESVRREAQAGSDTAALYIEVHAALLGSLMRMGRDWQRLLEDCAPGLKLASDEYNAELDPAPQTTEALINELVRFTLEVGDFLRDQGAQLQHEVMAAQDEILGRLEGERPVWWRRRRKA